MTKDQQLAAAKETNDARRRAQISAFLDALADTCNAREAARVVGIAARTPHHWRKLSRENDNDPAWLVTWSGDDEPKPFYLAWDEAMDAAIENIEKEVHRRAVEGVEEPLVFKGRKTGDTIKRKSDLMLIFLAKRHRHEFRDSFNVQPVVNVQVNVESARERLAEKLAAAAERRLAALAEASQATQVIDVQPERAALPAKKEE